MTFRRLRDRFEFHEPQTLYLKGKGDMRVYRMIGKKPGSGRRTAATAA
jgi:hypothetical protein